MDIAFFHTLDGGDVLFENGLAKTDQGLEAAVILSLFGGNEEDAGTGATEDVQWWGNRLDQDSPERHLRSKFQAATLNYPLNSATLQLFQEAAETDLAWMTSEEVADSVTVSVSIAAPKKLALSVEIQIRNDVFPFKFERVIAD